MQTSGGPVLRQAEVLDVFTLRTAAVNLSGYIFFGSSVDISGKAVQARL